jgi:hypothetical protein
MIEYQGTAHDDTVHTEDSDDVISTEDSEDVMHAEHSNGMKRRNISVSPVEHDLVALEYRPSGEH